MQPGRVKRSLRHVGLAARLTLVGLVTAVVLTVLLGPTSPLAPHRIAAIENAESLTPVDIERAKIAYVRIAAPTKIFTVLAVLVTAGLAALTIIRDHRARR